MAFQSITFSLTGRPWFYRGEGNANIVISLPKDGKVLRLRKSSKQEKLINDSALLQQLQLELKFMDLVMRAILGDCFVKPPCLVHLTEEDIHVLNSDLQFVRPEVRQGKHLSLTFAQLCEDLTLIHSETASVCVELKPKQGAFPPSHSKSGKCSFCLKQQLKLNEGQTSSKSQYCPLDLFSGVQSRMLKAVESLLHTPQNNLKIFFDGKLIFGDGDSMMELHAFLSSWLQPSSGSDLVEQFSSLLVQSLTWPFAPENCLLKESAGMGWRWDGLPSCQNRPNISDEKSMSVQKKVEKSCDWNSSSLPDGCVLQKLVLAQSMDLFGLDLVQEMSSKYKCDVKGGKAKCVNLQYVHQVLNKGCSSKLDPVEAYLIASTVRDCSILITFQKVLGNTPKDEKQNSLPTVVDNSSKGHYRFKISVVDIDPKPFSCINNHILKREACNKANETMR